MHGIMGYALSLYASSMNKLPFQKGEFDLIWSEGFIANIGFEKGLKCNKGIYVVLPLD